MIEKKDTHHDENISKSQIELIYYLAIPRIEIILLLFCFAFSLPVSLFFGLVCFGVLCRR